MFAASKETQSAIATALSALFDGLTVRLYKNDLAPAANTPLASFTQADFVGYLAIDGGTPVIQLDDGTGDLKVTLNLFPAFTAGAIVAPQTVYGWYLTDDPATEWYVGAQLDAPFTFAVLGDGIVLPALTIRIPEAALQG